ncbi:MAG: integration host factor subunit alpha [Herminiimonas sp.]|nr:integration host factor subunit alpha [Herminiimonas sp.]
MNDANPAELQSVLAADLDRAVLEAQVRSQAEKDLPTLTKAELAELLFEQVGLNKREAKDMVETFFDEIRNALESGEPVKLSGFGNFQLRDKPQRPGRNPKTGEEIPITARRVVTFHPSQKLKAMVELDNQKMMVRAA